MSNLILPASCQSSLGNPNIRTSTSHKVYAWRHLKFWASQGRIHIINEADGPENGAFTTCARREFILRAMGMNDAISAMAYNDERRDHHTLVEKMQLCLQDAKHQGDPHVPEQLADKLKGGRGRAVFGSLYPRESQLPRSVYPDGSPFRPDIRYLKTAGLRIEPGEAVA